MIRTTAAACILGVSTNTLRSWERRYGYPRPRRSSGGHRRYALDEIQALRQTLAETQNVSSAIELARRRGAGPASAPRLGAAFASIDQPQADRLLEESLVLRSLERTVEEVLVPAVAEQASEAGATAEYELAWRYGMDWLSALARQATPSSGPVDVLLFDASAPCDLDALCTQALELFLRRAGLSTARLTPEVDRGRLSRALRMLQPRAVIITGQRSSLDTIGRIVYALRSARVPPLVLDYRGAIPEPAAVERLGDSPLAARDAVVQALQSASPRSHPA
jgi:MerR family transcriptional regulator, light-induced transcriptional regulator